uniref:7TM GPCR serpentine receptor class x (Srx) domain-containing protein n=2 Tax=Strongyloides stercoralis TaxID=6248 RepID=A0AAF5D4X4_STRER
MFYLNHICFILTGSLTFTRELCLITFFTQKTFGYLYYASFAMLSACSFATSLHCLERIFAFYKLKYYNLDEEYKSTSFIFFGYFGTIFITGITQLLGNYYDILNSISSSLLFLTIQIITFLIFLYTVYKTNLYYQMKTSEIAISLPLSYKYQLQEIYKSSKLLTLIIFSVVFSNIEGCCHTLIMYLQNDKYFDMVFHAITFQFVVNSCILFRLLILIFLHRKLRSFVNGKLLFHLKSSKIEPIKVKQKTQVETVEYFKFYAGQW